MLNAMTMAKRKIANSNGVYTSIGGDFKATANDGTKTITITGLPFTLEASHVIAGSIELVDTDGYSFMLNNDAVTVSSGVITLLAMASNFESTDTVNVELQGKPPKSSTDVNATITNEQNVPWNRTITSQPVLSSAQLLTGTAADVGSEINCEGYNYAYFYMTTTIVATDTDFRLTVFAKHESGGGEEMPMDDNFVEISGSTFTAPSTAALPWFEQTENKDADLLVKVELNNCVKFLQLQAHLGTDTTGTSAIDTLDVVLGY